MNKEFVPYQPSLELKELGFDEPCFGRYDGKGANKGKIWYEMPNQGQETIPVGDVLAPTFSQAFRWFREKYDYIEFNVYQSRNQLMVRQGFNYIIETIDKRLQSEILFNKYEEAELNCLIKLIQIAKTK